MQHAVVFLLEPHWHLLDFEHHLKRAGAGELCFVRGRLGPAGRPDGTAAASQPCERSRVATVSPAVCNRTAETPPPGGVSILGPPSSPFLCATASRRGGEAGTNPLRQRDGCSVARRKRSIRAVVLRGPHGFGAEKAFEHDVHECSGLEAIGPNGGNSGAEIGAGPGTGPIAREEQDSTSVSRYPVFLPISDKTLNSTTTGSCPTADEFACSTANSAPENAATFITSRAIATRQCPRRFREPAWIRPFAVLDQQPARMMQPAHQTRHNHLSPFHRLNHAHLNRTRREP